MPRHSLYALLRFTICFLVTFAFSYDFPTFAVFHPTWFLMSFLYLLVVSSFSSCFLSILFSSCFLFSALFQEQISKDKLDFSYLSPDIHSWNAYLSGNLIKHFSCSFFFCFLFFFSKKKRKWWAQMDSNHRPHAYQACALTTWAMRPVWWRWGGSNSWPPACKAGALPAELHPRRLKPFYRSFSSFFKIPFGIFKIEQWYLFFPCWLKMCFSLKGISP